MMSNNKILTVSYGTFSCTLEGFDDSFGTMKAIAEYFRDLASDDRYFGAEPPQPDAEMLARIAQKEISRRVEARERDGKIVLSALEDQSSTPDVAATAAPLAAAATTAEAPQPIADAPRETPAPVAPPQAEPVAEVAPAPQPVAPPPVEAAPAASVEDTADLQDVPEEDTVAEDAPVEKEAAQEPIADQIVPTDGDEDENDIVPGQPDAEVEAFFADSAHTDADDDMLEEDESATTPLTLVASNDPAPAMSAETDGDDSAAEIEAEDITPAASVAEPDSIAAKLERIRAVVARQNDADEDDDYLEDEHAELEADADADADDGVIAQARADIEDALDADDAADTAAHAEEDDDAEDELTAMLSRLDDTSDADDAQDAVQDTVEADGQDEEISSALENLFEADADAAPKSDDEGPRARVIKVKRADLEAAIEKGDLEEYEADTSETSQADVDGEEDVKADAIPALDDVAPAKTTSSSLSAEEEADLVRELVELEADINGEEAPEVEATMPEAEDLVAEDVDDAFEEPSPAEVQELDAQAEEIEAEATDTAEEDKPATRNVLPDLDEGDSSDMNRLLAETDSQMDEPESATRRDAFAHLRAAVAARKADGTMEAEDAATKDANAYRSDLADVVRPRRPEAPSDGTRTARPSEGRPAPLKLVAEQRIDLDKPSNAGPVRPRRVSAVADATPTPADADSFADYASDLGATKLPELLEAAASYMSFVEGREEFSRPQLMTKVRQAGPSGEFSREDGLRSFGQLLRSGKIEKIKGGRFTVSDDIGYRPDERAAG